MRKSVIPESLHGKKKINTSLNSPGPSRILETNKSCEICCQYHTSFSEWPPSLKNKLAGETGGWVCVYTSGYDVFTCSTTTDSNWVQSQAGIGAIFFNLLVSEAAVLSGHLSSSEAGAGENRRGTSYRFCNLWTIHSIDPVCQPAGTPMHESASISCPGRKTPDQRCHWMHAHEYLIYSPS